MDLNEISFCFGFDNQQTSLQEAVLTWFAPGRGGRWAIVSCPSSGASPGGVDGPEPRLRADRPPELNSVLQVHSWKSCPSSDRLSLCRREYPSPRPPGPLRYSDGQARQRPRPRLSTRRCRSPRASSCSANRSCWINRETIRAVRSATGPLGRPFRSSVSGSTATSPYSGWSPTWTSALNSLRTACAVPAARAVSAMQPVRPLHGLQA